MFHRFLKITSPNGQQRWVNLDRVTRVSLATDSSGYEVLVFCFDENDQVKIHGTDSAGQELIRGIVSALNGVAEAAGARLAA